MQPAMNSIQCSTERHVCQTVLKQKYSSAKHVSNFDIIRYVNIASYNTGAYCCYQTKTAAFYPPRDVENQELKCDGTVREATPTHESLMPCLMS